MASHTRPACTPNVVVHLTVGPSSPAQALAWAKLWRRLLGPDMQEPLSSDAEKGSEMAAHPHAPAETISNH